jgi:radical SAM protein with 4Fe4S-binding SPASM domain
LPDLTRQSEQMVKHELDMICQLLWRANLKEWIVRELGSLEVLESWVDAGDVMVHRQPRGLIFCNLAGNAFILSVLSIIFALLSKNVALLKLSSEEPYFAVRFAESLRQIHPELAQDVAALYWPGESRETYEALFDAGLGAVVAWGEAASVKEMARLAAQHRVHFVDHGPKFGLEVIEKPSQENARSLAYNVALDIVPWEQYACLSPRVVFVQDGEVNAQDFAQLLAEEMERVSQELPNDKIDCQRASPVLSNREYYIIQLEMAGLGRLFHPEGSSWTVVYSSVTPTATDLNSCQGRFVIVSRIEDTAQVLAFIDTNRLGPYLQTMSYQGNDLGFIHAATQRGISDVTLPGQVNVKPLGSSHDGLYNLVELTYAVSRKRTEAERSARLSWHEEVARRFAKMLDLTPSLFREVAKETISEVAEANARGRGAACVEEWDLVHAYLQKTPEVFQPQVMENAIAVGIDIERYLPRERILQMQDLSKKMAWDQVQRQFHPDVTWFEWCITPRCNLRCRYCYEEAGKERPNRSQKELVSAEATQIIRSLGQASRELGRQFVICWSGGEPLLRQDLLELIACARQEGLINSLATNGALLTPELADRLRELEVANVLISVDSLEPEIHDSLRGKGTHAQALRAIEYCKRAGLLVMVETVATRPNWQEIGKLKRWAEEEVGAFFFYRPALQVGRARDAEISMTPEQYRELYFERNREVFDKLERGKGTSIPLFSIFDLVPFGYSLATQRERDHLEWGVGCQACRLIHGISASGELLPCIRFKLPLGNLLQESFREISEKEIYRKIALRKGRGGACHDCPHVDLCGGGCLAEVMALSGDPFAGWERCWFSNPRRGS